MSDISQVSKKRSTADKSQQSAKRAFASFRSFFTPRRLLWSVGTLAAVAATREAANIGVLPNPFDYAFGNETAVYRRAAKELARSGDVKGAVALMQVSTRSLQQQVFTNLNLGMEEYERLARRDALNHIQVTTPRDPTARGEIGIKSGEEHGAYYRQFDVVYMRPGCSMETLRHEFTHRLGGFRSLSVREAYLERGPYVELEEGIARIGGGGFAAASYHPVALNTALLAILLGADAKSSIETGDQLGVAYRGGIKLLARAFLSGSVEPIRSAYDAQRGAGRFDTEYLNLDFRTLGEPLVTSSLLRALEGRNRAFTILELLERSFMDPVPPAESLRSRSLRNIQTILNSALDSAVSSPDQSGELAALERIARIGASQAGFLFFWTSSSIYDAPTFPRSKELSACLRRLEDFSVAELLNGYGEPGQLAYLSLVNLGFCTGRYTTTQVATMLNETPRKPSGRFRTLQYDIRRRVVGRMEDSEF